MNTSFGVIYLATCRVNGKRYVGQTIKSDPSLRWARGHLVDARRGSKYPIHRAIRKYGVDQFDFEIIWHAPDQSSLDISEISFIELFETLVPSGYNLRHGGSRGKHSDITKIKMSISQREVNQRPGMSEKKSIAIKTAMALPENKLKHRIACRIARNDPINLENWKKANAKPEVTAKRKSSAKIALNQPEVLAKLSKAIKLALASPEMRERISVGTKAGIDNPLSRQRRLDAALRSNADPAVRLKKSIGAKLACTDPIVLERKRIAGLEVMSRKGQREKLSSAISVLRWVNDGIRNFRINKDLPLPAGWSYGRVKK